MKKILVLLMLIITSFSYSQTGSIAGKITDKEMSNDPLPFASVIIKGTAKGAQTDFDGLFQLNDLQDGTYTVVISFVGYETIEVPNMVVENGKVTEINAGLGAGAVALDEVILSAPIAKKESEIALLLEQKKAIEIKESIGSQQLAKLGVSNAAAATTKISGVSSSEASGDVFVRGLGDRYLSTTMNGLPIPSDDVERKNIDLGIFTTQIIQNVGISKTYSATSSADQSSGNIDVISKELSGREEYSLGLTTGFNSNVNGQSANFIVSSNTSDLNFGFYNKSYNTLQVITQQTWNTEVASNPINIGFNFTVGKRFGEKLAFFVTGSQSTSFEYRDGEFKQFRSNFIDDVLPDAITYSKKITSTGLFNASYFINDRNKLKVTSLAINKVEDQVFEAGRSGKGVIFEETEPVEGLGQFIRDQNTKQSRLWVNQFSGIHSIGVSNKIDWAAGYNYVNAEEPNRIRNEINFDNNLIQLGRTGGFQQRKSNQKIDDAEYNGLLKNLITFKEDKENNKSIKLTIGANYRNKERKFESQFIGVEEAFTNAINPASIDNLSEVFTQQYLDIGIIELNILRPDKYVGELESTAGFINANFGLDKFNISGGFRYQKDVIDVLYDVGNIPGRIGNAYKEYDNIYSSLNFKYKLTDKQALRFAVSRTITLPEFKEIAPFEYVSPTGQVTRGNPDLEASTNFNYDLKWEFFPTAGQLISATAFYKIIEDPINKSQDRGSAGVFSYFNSGEKASIFGLELETRIDLIKSEDIGEPSLGINLNATWMDHSQDLKEVRDENGNLVRTFRFKGVDQIGLQGASNWIFNGTLNLSNNAENPWNTALTANYASDKIFALGSPEIQTAGDEFYNDSIIEKGFVTLDGVISKAVNDNLSLRLIGKNLLNPTIKRTQLIKPSTTGIEIEETVLSYTKGMQLSLGVNYKF